MIDTLNLWIDRAELSGETPFSVVAYLDDVIESNSKKFGYQCRGGMGDYKILVSEVGISLKGSLAKYYLPSNLYTLTRAATQEALEKMSDTLHLNIMGSAKVSRIDISTILPTSRPPQDYYPYLWNKPYFTRIQATENTLSYSTQKRQLIFYDKQKEAKAKGAVIPPNLEGCNLLRYELRLNNKVSQQLKTDKVYAGTLTESNFYSGLVRLWGSEYKTITKLNDMNTTTLPTTPRKAKNALLRRLLSKEKNCYEVIDAFMADLKSFNAFPDPKAYTRLKTELHSLLEGVNIAEESDLMKELEQQIDDIVKYCR